MEQLSFSFRGNAQKPLRRISEESMSLMIDSIIENAGNACFDLISNKGWIMGFNSPDGRRQV
jgi:hypothetical protein